MTPKQIETAERLLSMFDELGSWTEVDKKSRVSAARRRGLLKQYREHEDVLAKAGRDQTARKVRVFISYREEDQEFAHVLSEKMRGWGVENIYSFADPHGGTDPGVPIPDDVRKNIKKSHLVIVLFTKKDADWDWVNREIGSAETSGVRIVTFQLYDDEPRFGTQNLRIQLDESSLTKFVKSFLSAREFFHGIESPLWPMAAALPPAFKGFYESEAKDLLSRLQAAKERVEKSTGDAKEIKVFVSCRHTADDHRIGKCLAGIFTEWLKDTPADVRFSSRDPGLDDKTRQFLLDAHLVVLVYTDAVAAEGVSYVNVSNEAGVAWEPSVPTRFMVFQILSAKPDQSVLDLSGDNSLDTRRLEALRKFVEELFSTEGFFPGFPALVQSGAKASFLEPFFEQESKKLFEKLEEIRVSRLADPEERNAVVGTKNRWAFVGLKIEAADLQRVEEALETAAESDEGSAKKDEKAALKLRRGELAGSLKLSDGTEWGLNHFGYNVREEALRRKPDFATMVDVWQREAPGEGKADRKWADEILDEIWAFWTGQGGYRLSWTAVPSAHPSADVDFYPVLVQVDKYEDGARRYEVHMFILRRRSAR